VPDSLDGLTVADGDPVAARDIPAAVTAAGLVYDDGATQTFEPGGQTTYVEDGRETRGQWYVDENDRFCSFWPPTYRACYDLRWIVSDGVVAGIAFAEVDRGARFTGRYR
jgi:hypothetical protein